MGWGSKIEMDMLAGGAAGGEEVSRAASEIAASILGERLRRGLSSPGNHSFCTSMIRVSVTSLDLGWMATS